MNQQEADKINKFLGEMIAFHGRGEISNFITSLVVKNEPMPDSGYLCEKCTSKLFNGETDNEIARRRWEEYWEEMRTPKGGGWGTLKFLEFDEWLDKESK